ncbi:MAG: glycoside hydrolase family 3 N-terminal domain-containing protein [Elusimicrobiota bacterium]
MRIEKKLARLVYPELRFGKTSLEEAKKLVKEGVGGFCIYGGSRDEIIEFTSALRAESDHRLVFAADYENGAGQWIKEGTLLPNNMAVGASGDPEIAKRKAVITACEAAALGIDWIFAPVLDLAEEHENPIVNLRAFSDNVSKVTAFAASYMKGLDAVGAISSVKHFPGHGSTKADSHLTLPEVSKNADQIWENEIAPFRALCRQSDSVMVGHLKIPSLDADNITSFSDKIISGLIRKRLSFDKVVITDALSMKAISDEGKAGVKALLAGADILLVPEDPYKLFEALNKAYLSGLIREEIINSALARQEVMAAKPPRDFFSKYGKDIIGCREHKKFVSEIAEKCQVAVKDEYFPRKKIYYWEDGEKTKDLKGNIFVEELRKSGVSFSDSVSDCDCVVLASFSRPRAYSGKINLAQKDKEEINKLLSCGKPVSMICFGSPFAADDYLNRLKGLICSFCDLPEFQEKAAQGFMHKANLTGEMPVRLGK